MLFQRSLSTEKWNQLWNAWASLQGKCDCFSGTAIPQGASEDVQPSFFLPMCEETQQKTKENTNALVAFYCWKSDMVVKYIPFPADAVESL